MMATQEDFVIVQRKLFDCMRQHCESCDHFTHFNIQLQGLADGRVVVLSCEPPSHSNKRKASYPLEGRSIREPAGSSQQVSARTEPLESSEQLRIIQSEPQQSVTEPSEPPQQPEIEPSESQQSVTEPSITESLEPLNQSGPRQKKSRNVQAVNRVIQNAPRTIEWRRKQRELGLNTTQEYEHVVRGLTCRTLAGSKWESHEEQEQSDNKLVAIGKGLASLTKSSLRNEGLQRSFAYFQALILLSYCEFLRQKGVPYEIIDELIRTVADIRESDRKSLLNTIKWINNTFIVDLVRKGWTIYRATELLFISKLPIQMIEPKLTFNFRRYIYL
jgi:hypothetical protein